MLRNNKNRNEKETEKIKSGPTDMQIKSQGSNVDWFVHQIWSRDSGFNCPSVVDRVNAADKDENKKAIARILIRSFPRSLLPFSLFLSPVLRDWACAYTRVWPIKPDIPANTEKG